MRTHVCRKAIHAWRAPFSRGLLAAVCLLFLGSCAPEPVVPPPITYPSVVTTEDGMAFYVSDLKLTGTSQKLRLREGSTLTWIPLPVIQYLRFTGPLYDTYRPAVIVLDSGGRFQGEIMVDELILQGQTDIGYWNMPLKKVMHIKMGTR